MKNITTFLFLLIGVLGFGQATTTPSPAIATAPVTVNFDKTGTPLATYTGTIYAHIGLTVDGQDWQYVKGSWGDNTVQPALTFVTGTTYKLDLNPDLYTYFGVPSTSTITKICVVFRAATGSPQSSDIFLNVGAFQVSLNTPVQNSVTLLNSGGNFNITASNTGGNASYSLKANGAVINSNAATTNYAYNHTNITTNQNYELTVTQGSSSVVKTFSVIVNPVTVSEAMPAGVEDGITYSDVDNTVATLVLDAPGKDYVYVAGSFNNWTPTAAYAMKKDPETGKFWLQLSGLTSGEIYSYQYWVVDETPLANSPKVVKTGDPYSTLVLSPYDDPGIPASTYPNPPAYPQGQEREVTVLQTGQAAYDWQVTNFTKPKKEDLVIYEALVRDFDADRNYQDLIDKIDYFTSLGINAIELMPVMEFEGNESWGYNTSFHMALDKFYGPSDKLKELIDLCHQNGIAVILDVALNHAFGRNPMVRMWMDDPDGDGFGNPTTENPYFNTVAKHSYNVGNDFNHQQPRTKNYVKRVVRHWIEEYHIDGFRWDLTKGFTQNCTESDETCTNAYQQDRVDVLKEYADYSWSLDPTHYTIFEHLGTDAEEKEWANYKYDEGKGVMLWGKMTDPYNQLTMGYSTNNNIARVGHMAHNGFLGKRVVGYAESHDEERLMYKNLQYGNSNANYNVKDAATALNRMSAQAAVFFMVPGPKMVWHFGELGWDLSIFTCNNGTVNPTGGTDGDCKLDTKPQPQWTQNWMGDTNRSKIYYNWRRMIQLKKDEAVFEGNYTLASTNTLTPKVYISDATIPSTELNSVVVLSNFDIVSKTITPDFPTTGTWYNLMNNASYEVTDTAATITLEPGEFRIFGNQTVVLGTGENTIEKVALYPNPTSDVFALNIAVNKLEIYSLTGQLVKTFSNTSAYTIYDVNSLTSGMYLVKVIDTENRQSTLKLIRK
ncbi:alpha-amylase family glycosyl hydrolase [Flavobacterium sp. AG291]|uniref:alpha-amylase family glycosyl hydrolase n=1 Tax=Flavobacterium sp. AG291 TaxID=2184000 RepID=UPI000E0BCF00|nr:alpha-amylase family glycosyl hydrolase [Flavobacterium sp. AG291]RDI04626.1 putative secreted protein (Por secretion system target) [Flavobacterium sp. AG291]